MFVMNLIPAFHFSTAAADMLGGLMCVWSEFINPERVEGLQQGRPVVSSGSIFLAGNLFFSV